MRKRLLAGSFAVALAGGLAVTVASPALSEDPPPHGHLFLTGVVAHESGDYLLSVRKCRPLANGEPVPMNAHHSNLHTGKAGEMQWDNAGNLTLPVLEGRTPWSDCESAIAFLTTPPPAE